MQLANGTTTHSSFRDFPATTQWGSGGDAATTIRIEIRPHRYQRSVLTAQGVVKQDYDSDARKPIDAFLDAGDTAAATGR